MTKRGDRGAVPTVRRRLVRRTLLISVPTHIAVFSILYFGGVRLVSTEMIRAHERDSRLLLATAMDDLHLTMEPDMPREEIRRRLTSFAEAHAEINLQFFSRSGELIAGRSAESPGGGEENRDLQALLAGPESSRYWLHRDAERSLVRGVVKIEADARCLPCHVPGEIRGVASITRDLSEEIDRLRRRLLVFVAVVVTIWAVLTFLIHRMLARAAQRSAARMQADLDAIRNGQPAGSKSQADLILDPMSLALFDSLSRLLNDHRERQEEFASRLHHADRLASLGRLAAGLAHEIKNPLAGIQGALEILRDETRDESTREVYEQMLAELHRVDGTIRGLLRFARPSPPRRHAADVPALLNDVVQLLRPGLARRGVELVLETAPNLGSFSLDAQQIRQVIVNLITNAAEAIQDDSRTSRGRISVRASVIPGDGSLVLAVADDGPGIAPDDAKKIFQPFFTSKFTGTGLGLAVVDSLVTQHAGRIELESQPGRGTTFFVILPDPSSVDSEPPAAGGE